MARPKGSPNKISGQVRRNVVSVFERLGGIEKMKGWAEENLTEFYKLYAKLLPSEVTVNIEEREQEQVDALEDDEFKHFAAACREVSARNKEARDEGETIN